jgi:hypothetical protein
VTDNSQQRPVRRVFHELMLSQYKNSLKSSLSSSHLNGFALDVSFSPKRGCLRTETSEPRYLQTGTLITPRYATRESTIKGQCHRAQLLVFVYCLGINECHE